MIDSVYEIHTPDDMHALEKRISELVLGEHGRCSLLNTVEFKRLRIAAVYGDRATDRQISMVRGPIRLYLNGSTIVLHYDMDDFLSTQYCGKPYDTNSDDEVYDTKRQKTRPFIIA